MVRRNALYVALSGQRVFQFVQVMNPTHVDTGMHSAPVQEHRPHANRTRSALLSVFCLSLMFSRCSGSVPTIPNVFQDSWASRQFSWTDRRLGFNSRNAASRLSDRIHARNAARHCSQSKI